ncbi:MAG: hypothetical protein HY367_01355 [Candidatus Aenigmarchaeota archaeon]|nr:hypothetical protein [Candidatus Aenigmarchaeota archaeon]
MAGIVEQKVKVNIKKLEADTFVDDGKRDSRHGTNYRSVAIGDPVYGLRLEISYNSPLYEDSIRKIRLYIETEKS